MGIPSSEDSDLSAAVIPMCEPLLHARLPSGDAAVSVFAMANGRNETRLWYALDHVQLGGRLGFKGSSEDYGQWMIEHEGQEHKHPPRLSACGRTFEPSLLTCIRHTSLVCHLRFNQTRLCPVRIHWAIRKVSIVAHFCPRGPAGPLSTRPVASACLPFYLPPLGSRNVQLTPALLEGLVRWLRFMRTQVGLVTIHALSRSAAIQAATRGEHGRMVVRGWDAYEANNYTTLLPELSGYHNHFQTWVLTKCLCEDRDLAQWTLLLDADEYWVSLPPAPQLGLGQFLAKLPASQQQHLFCTAEEACNLPVGPRAARYRPKAALRSGRCSWYAGPHFSEPLPRGEAQPAACSSGFQGWDAFDAACQSPPPRYYVSHDRFPPRAEACGFANHTSTVK